MLPVEGYEIHAILFGRRSDQGVREAIVEVPFLVLLNGRYTQILADFISQDIADLGVARNSGATVLCRVVPPGMIAALSKKLAAVAAQVAQQLAALHRAMRSSTNCSPAAVNAS